MARGLSDEPASGAFSSPLKPGAEPVKALVDCFLDAWQFEANRFQPRPVTAGLDRPQIAGKTKLSDLIEATDRRRAELGQPRRSRNGTPALPMAIAPRTSTTKWWRRASGAAASGTEEDRGGLRWPRRQQARAAGLLVRREPIWPL